MTTAAELDAADPLASFRDRFVLADDVVAYLDGNSLGRLPIATRDAVRDLIEQGWGRELIRGWDHWVDLPTQVGDEVGAILGAARGQTIVADSTTVCLFKQLHVAAALRPDRRELVAARSSFPTDRYVVEAVAQQRALDVRWVDDPSALADALTEQTAAVLLDHVDFRTGARLDVPTTTRLVHDVGAVVVWDLCHSAGLFPHALDADGVDLAVGCTYKYLNAGPGAPAFMYVAERHLDGVDQPIPGWFSAADVFAMAPGYAPSSSITRLLSGTPPVGGMIAVREGVRLVAEAGVDAIWAKAELLTAHAIDRLDGLDVVTPQQRGGHVSVRQPDARRLTADLVARGVIPDFREPDLIRLGFSPLTTSFAELDAGLAVLGELMDQVGPSD